MKNGRRITSRRYGWRSSETGILQKCYRECLGAMPALDARLKSLNAARAKAPSR
nr:MAG TPA: hypothetical protein [Caudoviricetes sp.]